MKSIIRRLGKLEDRLGLAPETEFDRQLRARIEAGRHRLAKAKERGEWHGSIHNGEWEDFARLSVFEILQRGRKITLFSAGVNAGWQRILSPP